MQVCGNLFRFFNSASRFFNSAKLKYSTNELELLAEVWACEQFRTCLLGNKFEILTDHKATLSALKEHRGNKAYQSRLTRWADKLLPFDYDIRHIFGAFLGLADYLSQNPTFDAPPTSVYDELFVIKTIENFTQACNSIKASAAMPPGPIDCTFLSNISVDGYNSASWSFGNGNFGDKSREGGYSNPPNFD